MKIGAGVLLFMMFFIAKVTHYIDWPWIWVCAPLWIPLVLLLSFIGFVFFIHLLAGSSTSLRR